MLLQFPSQVLLQKHTSSFSSENLQDKNKNKNNNNNNEVAQQSSEERKGRRRQQQQQQPQQAQQQEQEQPRKSTHQKENPIIEKYTPYIYIYIDHVSADASNVSHQAR